MKKIISRLKSNSLAQKTSVSFIAATLLLLIFTQAVDSLLQLSVTYDEPVHALTGYSILRTGDLRLVEDHPPLLEIWQGWPLLLSPENPAPTTIDAWEMGDRRLFAYAEQWWEVPIESWLMPARLTTTLLSLLLGALLFRWAADWFGDRAGLLALALFTFDPNILAHSQLATLDLGVTLLMLATLYTLQRTLRNPQYGSILISGALLGLALAAKISAGLLVPLTGGLLLVWGWLYWDKKELLLKFILYASAAFITLWGIHLFQIGAPIGINLQLPAPTFWRSFLRIGRDVSSVARPAFLLGEFYRGGRWYYFPLVFLLKTPLPILILSLAAVLHLWRHPLSLWRMTILASFPLSYWLISVTANINIGYRHILPTLPFLYLSIGSLGAQLEKRSKTKLARYALPALLLWQLAGTLAVAPYHLTFFNELGGGPANGWRHLSDSNVDWNQGLIATQKYLDSHALEDVYLSIFTQYLPPEIYGLQETTPLPPSPEVPPVLSARYNPHPGTYILSASTLRGISVTLPEMYNWFWHQEPDDIIANSMLVYHVQEREPRPTWVAQCNLPVMPLSAQLIEERFSRSDLRQLDFDCTQSWLYPDNGLAAGWLVLHQQLLNTSEVLLQHQISSLQLSFEQEVAHAAPPHSIYEWQPQNPPLLTDQPYYAAPAVTVPAQLTAQLPLTATLALDGPLEFVGYELRNSAPPELITYWNVTAVPDAPFSLMAHLVTAEGQTLEVADGLGVKWHQLRPGDLFTQRHLFTTELEQSADAYYLRTGAYSLEDKQRWPSSIDPAADALFIPLSSE